LNRRQEFLKEMMVVTANKNYDKEDIAFQQAVEEREQKFVNIFVFFSLFFFVTCSINNF